MGTEGQKAQGGMKCYVRMCYIRPGNRTGNVLYSSFLRGLDDQPHDFAVVSRFAFSCLPRVWLVTCPPSVSHLSANWFGCSGGMMPHASSGCASGHSSVHGKHEQINFNRRTSLSANVKHTWFLTRLCLQLHLGFPCHVKPTVFTTRNSHGFIRWPKPHGQSTRPNHNETMTFSLVCGMTREIAK